MAFLYYLVAFFICTAPIAIFKMLFSDVECLGHSGPLATYITALIMLTGYMKWALHNKRFSRYILGVMLTLSVINILMYMLEMAINGALKPVVIDHGELFGSPIAMPNAFGLLLPLIYNLPRVLISIVGIRLFIRKSKVCVDAQEYIKTGKL
jgi:hypothetical protein